MPKIIDHTGKKFNRLLVLKMTGKRGNARLCLVRCDCGAEKEVVQSMLTHKTKPIRSCGCLAKDNHYRVHAFDPELSLKDQTSEPKERKTHGLTKHKFYHIWKAMVSRCHVESSGSFKDYGGRGITVCDDWRVEPLAFLSWLEENGYEKGLQIDRKDNNGNYHPGNCRLVTQRTNSLNRRNTILVEWEGQEIPLIELAKLHNIKYATLYKRINELKLSPFDAVNRKPWQRVGPVGG
jgi:hypothetical protein